MTLAEQIEDTTGLKLMQALKYSLRPSIKAAEGHTFVCGDWGQIEGRMVAWLAGAKNAVQRYVDATWERDVYCMAADAIVGREVRRIKGDSPEAKAADEARQLGKVAELALGFCGGVGAYQNMAAVYGVSMPDEEAALVVRAWRLANPWAVEFGRDLMRAAMHATKNPGDVARVRSIAYLHDGTHLWCELPSGRLLCYPFAKREWRERDKGEGEIALSCIHASFSPKAGEDEWPRQWVWHGRLSENVTQAACADILREALRELVLVRGTNVVGHTHDEILIECPQGQAEQHYSLLEEVMEKAPEWAPDLPLEAGLWTGPRYKKD